MDRSLTLCAAVLVAAASTLAAQAEKTEKPGRRRAKPANPPIRLVQIADLHGGERAFARGLHVLFDRVNAAGGVAGRKIELHSIDDHGEAKEARAALSEVLSRPQTKLGMFIGLGAAATDAKSIALIQGKGIPVFAAHTSRVDVRNRAYAGVYFLTANLDVELQLLVKRMQSNKITKVAGLFPQNDSGLAAEQALKRIAKAAKLTVGQSGFYEAGTKDVREAVDAIAGDVPGAIVLFADTAAAARAARLIRSDKDLKKTPIFGTSLQDPQAFVRTLGSTADDIVLTCRVPWPWKSWLPAAEAFTKDMTAAQAEADMGFAAFEGWLAGRVFCDVIEYRIGDAPVRAEFVRGLRALEKHSVDGLPVTFSRKDQDGIDFAFEVRCIAGKLEEIFPSHMLQVSTPGK